MKLFEKRRDEKTGRRRIYFCGVKVFSYKTLFFNSANLKNVKKDLENLKHEIRDLNRAIADPKGFGYLDLLLKVAHVAPQYHYIFQLMKDVDVCIDCGAHVGVFTDICVHQNAECHVFEPNIDVFPFLSRKYKNFQNVRLHNKGVWDRDDKICFYHDTREHQSFNGLSQGASFYNKSEFYIETTKVPVINLIKYLYDVLKEKETIYILKLDIEGAECEVLPRLIEEELYKKIKYIFVEVHDRYPIFKEKTDQIRRSIANKNISNIYLDWI